MKTLFKNLESIYLAIAAVAYVIVAIYLAGFIGNTSSVGSFSGSITAGLPSQVYIAGVVVAALACLFALAMALLHLKGRKIGSIAFWLLAILNLIGFAVVRVGMGKLEGKFASKSAYIAALDTVGVPLLIVTVVFLVAVMARQNPKPASETQPE
jgi:hypothetical protein